MEGWEGGWCCVEGLFSVGGFRERWDAKWWFFASWERLFGFVQCYRWGSWEWIRLFSGGRIMIRQRVDGACSPVGSVRVTLVGGVGSSSI